MLNTSRQYKGQFWVGNEAENWKYGILKFLNGTAYLDILGAFDKRENHRYTVDTVFGKLDNQSNCVFQNCRIDKSNPFHTTTYVNFRFFVYSSSKRLISEKLEFRKFKFQLDYINEWVGHNAFEPYFENDRVVGIKRSFNKMEDSELLLDNIFKLEISHENLIPVVNPYSNYYLKQDTYFILEEQKSVSFETILQYIDRVCELFIFMIGKKVISTNTIQLLDESNESFFCYRNQTEFREKPIKNDEHTPIILDILFSRGDLSENHNIKEVFNKWLSLYDKYEYSISKLVRALSGINQNQENILLNLMYSLEKLQAIDAPKISEQVKKNQQPSTKDEKHFEILTSKDVPKNTIDYLRRRIEKKESAKLKDKLILFLNSYVAHFQKIYNEDFELFIKKSVDTRNSLAHECEDCENKLEPNEIPDHNKKLKALIVLLFCEKLDIEENLAIEKIGNHPTFEVERKHNNR